MTGVEKLKHKPANQQLGKQGEKLAQKFLKEAGHKILFQNFRFGRSELDIISLDVDTVVICEVKSFFSDPLGEAELRVNPAKQRQIIKGAYGFISQNPEYEGHALRFDIILVDFSHYPANITWHKEAFWDEQGWG